ncbi:phenylacetaldehyde dehydrogenase StyD [Paraburkholderia ginsengisoli]|uniref:Aldehyde dehydrogenase family protein n=1 Tax=Paraburkholderia ginsengisoli TaxID=311231 RepID=A0A7T4N3Q1_9BURK|nr:aldehyde dehydrogenase family protein [Paraburkholderia ginsengisoli]QQC64666.1 aldehyde dehydrogenase family protein [Paraburkholderia ginsengisoli]
MSEHHLAAAALPQTMFINGEKTRSAAGKTFAVFNPATAEELAQIPDASESDIDHAVKTSKAAFESDAWRRMPPAARERLLLKLADLVEQHTDELAALETLNQGKLLGFSKMLEVAGSVQWLRYMAGWATKIEGTTFDLSIPFPPGTRYNASARRVPAGVVAAIVPWNFPLLMAVWKIAPALACGCTVVLKPAEETPLTAIRLAELAHEAGFPPGVFNVVTGRGETAGAALVRHPLVNKVTFTGSTEVGRIIGRQCAGDLKRASLELGGKSPVIVLDDCDPRKAIEGAAGAIFFNHGQVCTAGSRLYVARSIYDEVVQGVAAVADSIALGSGFDAATQMGPMVSARHRDKVVGMIAQGRQEGGEIVSRDARVDSDGYFVRPTVIANRACRPLSVVKEEVFGPVLVAMPYDDLDEVLAEANASEYGLGASVWTNQLDKALRLVDGIEAGTVWVNTHNMVDPAMPFGGFKASGIGREHGKAIIDAYTESKSVCIAY